MKPQKLKYNEILPAIIHSLSLSSPSHVFLPVVSICHGLCFIPPPPPRMGFCSQGALALLDITQVATHLKGSVKHNQLGTCRDEIITVMRFHEATVDAAIGLALCCGKQMWIYEHRQLRHTPPLKVHWGQEGEFKSF